MSWIPKQQAGQGFVNEILLLKEEEIQIYKFEKFVAKICFVVEEKFQSLGIFIKNPT